MERKIGEIFYVNGVKLKCVKHNNCLDCYFCDKGLQCMQQNCNHRKDLKVVMFIQTNE